MTLTWRELSGKEVISVCDGARLGYFCDLEADVFSGCILAFLLPDGKGFSLGKKAKYRVPRDKIERIGEDVILIRGYEKIEKECKN